jgi:hypothetical protein
MMLVGYWPLNSISSGETLDHSGNESHGSVSGAAEDANGLLGESSLSFAGYSDFVEISSSQEFNPETFCISVWYKPGSSSLNYVQSFSEDDGRPRSLTFDPNGVFWMGGTNSDYVYKYDTDWNLLNSYNISSVNNDPQGVEYYNGNIFVNDKNSFKIYKYDRSINQVNSYSYSSSLDQTRGMVHAEGYWWINEKNSTTIYKFDDSWNQLDSFNLSNSSDPDGLEYYNGIFYVQSGTSIDRYDSSFNHLGSQSFSSGATSNPESLLIHRGQAYISDEEKSGIYQYDLPESPIFSKSASHESGSYRLDADGNKAYGTVNQQTVSSSLESGWNHIVLNFTGQDHQLFINGIKKSEKNLSENLNTNTEKLRIGDSLTGNLQETRFYTRPLTKSEIQYLYQAGKRGRTITSGKKS